MHCVRDAHHGSGRPPMSPLNPPLVAVVDDGAGTGVPHASFVAFQSGTKPSGHRRAPITGPFTSTTASTRSPRDHTSTGSAMSWMVLSLNSNRRRTGNGTEVFRRNAITAL